MQGNDNGRAIALFVLIAGAIGAVVYFILRKKKKVGSSGMADGQAPKPKAENVVAKIFAGYNKGISTLTDAEVRKYATWFDRLEQLVLANRTGGYFTATDEAVYNAKMLLGLNEENFRAVVNYWQAVRGRSIATNAAFKGVLDETGILSDLLVRLRELKIIE